MYYYDDIDNKYYRYFIDEGRTIFRREILQPDPNKVKQEISIRYIHTDHILRALNYFMYGWEIGLIYCELTHHNVKTSGSNSREFKFTLSHSEWYKLDFKTNTRKLVSGNRNAYKIITYLSSKGYNIDKRLTSYSDISNKYYYSVPMGFRQDY